MQPKNKTRPKSNNNKQALFSARLRKRIKSSSSSHSFLFFFLSFATREGTEERTDGRTMLAAHPSGLRCRPYYPHSSHFSLSSRCKHSLSSNSPRFLASGKSSKLCSLSLLLSRRTYSERFTVKSSAAEPEVSEPVANDAVPSFPQAVSVKIPFGDRHVSFNFGTFEIRIEYADVCILFVLYVVVLGLSGFKLRFYRLKMIVSVKKFILKDK